MKPFLLACILALCAAPALACNVCGCSAGNQSLGILPESRKHFIGLQYQYRSYESSHDDHDGLQAAGSVSREQYQTLQVWGRYNLGKRVRLFGFLPYHRNASLEAGQTNRISGIGDLTLLANVQLIAREGCGPGLKQSLVAGGGVKLPTGPSDPSSFTAAEGLPNMQPGTRSLDVVANANYTIRNERVGVNLDASFTLTTPAPSQYKYGNRFSSALMGFYWCKGKQWTVLPQAGIRYDLTGRDYDHYRLRWGNDMTGGSQWYATAGVQAFYGKVGMQLSGHLPVAQQFAGGLVKARFRSEAGAFLFF